MTVTDLIEQGCPKPDAREQAEALLALVQKASPYDNDIRHLTLTESQYAAYVRMFDDGPAVIRALLGSL